MQAPGWSFCPPRPIVRADSLAVPCWCIGGVDVSPWNLQSSSVSCADRSHACHGVDLILCPPTCGNSNESALSEYQWLRDKTLSASRELFCFCGVRTESYHEPHDDVTIRFWCSHICFGPSRVQFTKQFDSEFGADHHKCGTMARVNELAVKCMTATMKSCGLNSRVLIMRRYNETMPVLSRTG